MPIRFLAVFLFPFLFCSAVRSQPTGQHRTSPRLAKDNALVLQLGLGAVSGVPAVGAGLCYERFLPKGSGRLSGTLQVAGCLGGTIRLYKVAEDERRSSLLCFYAAPGLRYHPLGHSGPVDLSLGLSVPLGAGHREDKVYRLFGPDASGGAAGLFAAGLGQFQAQFQPGKAGVFILYVSAGYVIASPRPAVSAAFGRDNPLFLQLGLAFGGRW